MPADSRIPYFTWVLVTVALLGSGLLCSGCGGPTIVPSCDVPGSLTLIIETSDQLNPDDRRRALPTVVRLFQLSSLGPTETATFQEMWQEHEELLADYSVGMDELTVYPERTITRSFERNPEANYLVVMGLFRNPAGVSWRTILELPPPPSEQECAARLAANDDEEPVPPGLNPRVLVEMDDYHLEGTLYLDPESGGGCTGLDCLEDAAQTVEDSSQEPPEIPDVEPETPDVPDAPDVPSEASGEVGAP